ncbi:hypothetical protein [Alteromonas sp. OM2203]|uniref:hypothetical protein n=1 Tax=Alteromonas sp. OM2203 TaxID=3398817 RepID=UPI003AF3E56B
MEDIEILFIAATIFILFLAFAFWFDYKRRKEEKQTHEKLCELVFNSSRNDAIRNLDDVIDIAESLYETKLILLSDFKKVELALQKTKAKLSQYTFNSKEREVNLEKINELLKEIKSKIEEEEKVAPFEGVPDPERSQLELIYTVTDAGNKAAILAPLQIISKSIKSRAKLLEEEKVKSQKYSKWGILATFITFGIAMVITFLNSSATGG